jgi:hypothetical protein
MPRPDAGHLAFLYRLPKKTIYFFSNRIWFIRCSIQLGGGTIVKLWTCEWFPRTDRRSGRTESVEKMRERERGLFCFVLWAVSRCDEICFVVYIFIYLYIRFLFTDFVLSPSRFFPSRVVSDMERWRLKRKGLLHLHWQGTHGEKKRGG